MRKIIIISWLMMCFMGLTFGVRAQDVDTLEAKIKSGSASELKTYAESMRKKAEDKGKYFNARQMRQDIFLNYHISLLQEAFYHMKTLAPYYRYKEALELKKLEALKKNKERYESGEISKEDYLLNIEKIKRLYQTDLKDTENFLKRKIMRLRDICNALDNNLANLRKGNGLEEGEIPNEVRERILFLKSNPTWVAFSTRSPEGEKIRRVLTIAPGGGSDLVACLEKVFDPFEAQTLYGPVFPPDLIERVVSQYE